jgi:hypothetical protein
MTVFECHKAHGMIEKLAKKKIKRDHRIGNLKFEIPDEY